MSNPAPRVGRTFKSKIHEISDSGNGIIQVQESYINIGPVLPGGEGVLVEALKLPGPYARCNNSTVLPDDYTEQIAEQFPHDLPFGGDVKEKFEEYANKIHIVEVQRITNNTGEGVVDIEGSQVLIGKVNESVIGSNICVERKGPQKAEPVNENDIKTHIVEVDRISQSGNGVVFINGVQMLIKSADRELVGSEVKVVVKDHQFVTLIDTSISERGSNNPEIDDGGAQKTNDDVSSGDVTSADDSEVSLSKLRRQAVNESKQSTSSQTTSKSTEQYNRSEKVKQYVKERASGVCEGCEKEAPFVSKTGDPYFHAHHVYELSEGGADTPDTVIALCPNCHYRVHHGQDGQEYNQELIEKLEDIEPK